MTARLPPWQRWWGQRRRPAATATHTLGWHNIYLWPTRAGWLLLAVIATLMLLSVNYQLNLGYLLCFLLLGCTLGSAWFGHRNLRGLRLQLHAVSPVFAGDAMALSLLLHAPQGHLAARHAILMATRASLKEAPSWVCVDVPHKEHAQVTLGAASTVRGHWPVATITVHSLFPLGVFRLWSHWQPLEHVWVYPAPEAQAPPLTSTAQPVRQHSAPAANATPAGVEPDGVRLYQRGDPVRHIVWRKAAQTLAQGNGVLVSRSFHSEAHAALWLDESTIPLPTREARLARLSAWVLQAHASAQTWGLRLSTGRVLMPTQGETHLHHCLQLLAQQPHTLPSEEIP